MPPRKDGEPPRRSGRIASQESQPVAEKPKPKATKKRTAGDEAKDGEGSTAKKVLKLLFFPPFFWEGELSILILLILFSFPG